MELIDFIVENINDDDVSIEYKSNKLINNYILAKNKKIIDDVFITLTGYSLKTLIEMHENLINEEDKIKKIELNVFIKAFKPKTNKKGEILVKPNFVGENTEKIWYVTKKKNMNIVIKPYSAFDLEKSIGYVKTEVKHKFENLEVKFS